MNVPFVSIIIPCRNEETFIGKCLDSIVAQDYPKGRFEALIVDGMSDDGTRDIIRQYSGKCFFLKCFDNPKKIVPSALNIGIVNSIGEVIIRMDAHTFYEKDYISRCIKYLNESKADNVGGIWITMPGSRTVVAGAIALALSSRFGVGNASYRIGSRKPKFVDTVPFGCYRKEVFKRIGLFDEDLVRNQDDEFNLRLIKHGGKILLAPDIVSYYYARDSLSKVWKMYWQYGYFKPLVVQKLRAVLTWRQLIPPLFVVSLIVSFLSALILKPLRWVFVANLLLYLSANLSSSLILAFKHGVKYLPVLPFVFFTLHFSYALGYLKGILDFLILKKNERERIRDLPLTR